jgi:hypothetical protein
MKKTALLFFLFGLFGCGSDAVLDLQLVFAGADPLSSVDEIRLRLVSQNVDSAITQKIADPSRFSLELSTPADNRIDRVVLEGFSGGSMVARGETPDFVVVGADEKLSLLVAAAGRFSTLTPKLPQATHDPVILPLRGLGVLVAGGEDATGDPLSGAVVYDFFDHQLRSDLPPMPQARAGAVSYACGTSCAVVLLGKSAAGLADQVFVYNLDGWRTFDDSLPAGQRRSGAAIAPLDAGYLVAGGVDKDRKPLSTLLLVEPRFATAPVVTVLAKPALAARAAPAVAASSPAVLIAGGQAVGEPPAELFIIASRTSQAIAWTGPEPARGSAAAALADGRLVLVGGQTAAGDLLRDAWIVDPAALKVEHVPDALANGRAFHQLIRVGEQLLCVGGQTAAGDVVDAELLSTARLQSAGTVALAAARRGHRLAPLGGGALLVIGGTVAASKAGTLELFQTAQPGL